MTPEEFTQRMQELWHEYGWDQEVCHRHMEDLMVAVLCELGYGEGVAIFKTTPKWYA